MSKIVKKNVKARDAAARWTALTEAIANVMADHLRRWTPSERAEWWFQPLATQLAGANVVSCRNDYAGVRVVMQYDIQRDEERGKIDCWIERQS